MSFRDIIAHGVSERRMRADCSMSFTDNGNELEWTATGYYLWSLSEDGIDLNEPDVTVP